MLSILATNQLSKTPSFAHYALDSVTLAFELRTTQSADYYAPYFNAVAEVTNRFGLTFDFAALQERLRRFSPNEQGANQIVFPDSVLFSHGERANTLTVITFPVWTKAPQGELSDEQLRTARRDLFQLLHDFREAVNAVKTPAEVTPFVTFNWLTSAAPAGGIGEGGTGHMIYNSTITAPAGFDWSYGWSDQHPLTGEQAVAVYVVDTAPASFVGSGVSATQTVTTAMLGSANVSGHPFVASVTNGDVRILPTTSITLPSQIVGANGLGVITNAAGNPVAIPDHGLFSAALIAGRAPKAKINFVRVLNDYAIGTFQSLAQGLGLVVSAIANDSAKSVVNLSLCFANPTTLVPFEGGSSSVEQYLQYLFGSSTATTVAQLLQDIAQLLGTLNSALQSPQLVGNYSGQPPRSSLHLVAAAGNDSVWHIGAVFPAWYPALVDGVIGVGSVGRKLPSAPNFTPADYSNIADSNVSEAVWSFGGDWEKPAPSTPNADQVELANAVAGGLLSLWSAGASGLAYGAGTSYATGLVSGALASILATNQDANTLYGIAASNPDKVQLPSGLVDLLPAN